MKPPLTRSTRVDAFHTIFSSEPSEFDCDFEKKNLCEWRQLDGSDFDVLVTEASTQELPSDPSEDHSGNGTLIDTLSFASCSFTLHFLSLLEIIIIDFIFPISACT